MLTSEWAIAFNLISIAVTVLLLATVLLSCVWVITARYTDQFSLYAQKRILWLFVSAPWLLSLICLLVFLPSLLLSQNTTWLVHWHHPNEFYLASWHGALLIIFTLGFAYILIRKVVNASRHLIALDSLTGLFQKKGHHWQIGSDVVVLESRTPLAFSAGIFNPKCYVTSGLVEQFSDNELDIIIEHERAHIKHRDLQQKLLFSLLISLFPKQISLQLNRLFSLTMEKLADTSVSMCHSRLDIAQTLVKSARVQKLATDHSDPAFVNYFIANDVDSRVKALIGLQEFRPFPWSYCLLVLGLVAITSLAGVDALHHLIETFFSH